jgi:hypothetical protein
VGKMYVVLALFMLMGVVQKPTLRSYYKNNWPLLTPVIPLQETLALEKLEVIIKFMHFSDNSKQNEFQGCSKVFRMYPVIQHLSNNSMGRLFVFQTIHTLQGCQICH